jgi:hypothetical protein
VLIDRDVIGFGGGKQQLVDHRRKQPAKQVRCP